MRTPGVVGFRDFPEYRDGKAVIISPLKTGNPDWFIDWESKVGELLLIAVSPDMIMQEQPNHCRIREFTMAVPLNERFALFSFLHGFDRRRQDTPGRRPLR